MSVQHVSQCHLWVYTSSWPRAYCPWASTPAARCCTVSQPSLRDLRAHAPKPAGSEREGGERNSGEVVHSRTLQAQTHTGVIICWYQYGLY